ncbi:hypothetical protein BT63DRAFT_413593 [Microthyrium microscopicum]|uniref:Uncharacterized protein n=1 Tax=Microthyrium microscopicum TaxID=703497 RepID=A0A6A6UAZ8_9PEZI|nr:hypothetical protein BT63DRAFT_413593 [Microthyrium microscopicum]
MPIHFSIKTTMSSRYRAAKPSSSNRQVSTAHALLQDNPRGLKISTYSGRPYDPYEGADTRGLPPTRIDSPPPPPPPPARTPPELRLIESGVGELSVRELDGLSGEHKFPAVVFWLGHVGVLADGSTVHLRDVMLGNVMPAIVTKDGVVLPPQVFPGFERACRRKPLPDCALTVGIASSRSRGTAATTTSTAREIAGRSVAARWSPPDSSIRRTDIAEVKAPVVAKKKTLIKKAKKVEPVVEKPVIPADDGDFGFDMDDSELAMQQVLEDSLKQSQSGVLDEKPVSIPAKSNAAPAVKAKGKLPPKPKAIPVRVVPASVTKVAPAASNRAAPAAPTKADPTTPARAAVIVPKRTPPAAPAKATTTAPNRTAPAPASRATPATTSKTPPNTGPKVIVNINTRPSPVTPSKPKAKTVYPTPASNSTSKAKRPAEQLSPTPKGKGKSPKDKTSEKSTLSSFITSTVALFRGTQPSPSLPSTTSTSETPSERAAKRAFQDAREYLTEGVDTFAAGAFASDEVRDVHYAMSKIIRLELARCQALSEAGQQIRVKPSKHSGLRFPSAKGDMDEGEELLEQGVQIYFQGAKLMDHGGKDLFHDIMKVVDKQYEANMTESERRHRRGSEEGSVGRRRRRRHHRSRRDREDSSSRDEEDPIIMMTGGYGPAGTLERDVGRDEAERRIQRLKDQGIKVFRK